MCTRTRTTTRRSMLACGKQATTAMHATLASKVNVLRTVRRAGVAGVTRAHQPSSCASSLVTSVRTVHRSTHTCACLLQTVQSVAIIDCNSNRHVARGSTVVYTVHTCHMYMGMSQQCTGAIPLQHVFNKVPTRVLAHVSHAHAYRIPRAV